MDSNISLRLFALKQLAGGYRRLDSCKVTKDIFSNFGRDVFGLHLMRDKLPKDVFERLCIIGRDGWTLAAHDADTVAIAMKDWAIKQGATHYTHWFQPMTGITAEKHDSFLVLAGDGTAISEFSGKNLVKGESDASSFPSGGLRSTFEARGYTAWDPSSPAFISRYGETVTLCIPTVFYSYTGESLDRKTPLLRSITALSKQTVRLMNLIGCSDCESVEPQIGAEQEYFLVDRRLYSCRPDLVMSGRTLFGARAPKGQQMEDHYFAAIPKRILAFMNDVEQKLFALGVPVHTRHNEVAPSQYEVAPIFEPVNVATDHNMLVMEVLVRTAEDHDLACLLHEKPFNCVNGSGKHNNWSLVDNTGRNLLEPGAQPGDNLPFLLILAAILRAIHLYSPIWRLGIVGVGNDHRLGANEAPPTIISAYLGSNLEKVLEAIISGQDSLKGGVQEIVGTSYNLGVSSLQNIYRDTADRNRTSPMAFSGNKFEFRALGSSQSLATINISLNTTLAKTIGDIAAKIEELTVGGLSGSEAAWKLLPKLFKEHQVVVFNGDNYSSDWVKEAAVRGLPNLKDSVQTLALYDTPEIIEVFESQGVLSKAEILARQHILLEDYIGRLLIEADLTLSLGRTSIFPAVLKWQDKLYQAAKQAQKLVNENGPEASAWIEVRNLTNALLKSLKELETIIEVVKALKTSVLKKAETARDKILPAMNKVRDLVDHLETLVDATIWPLPTYADMFWTI